MNDQYLSFDDVGLVDFQPLDCGMEKCLPGYSFGPCIRGHYVLHYVFSGRGVLNKNGVTTPVHAGESFLIRPEETCAYCADEKDPWTYGWISFLGMQAKHFNLVPNVFPLPQDVFKTMLSVFDKEHNKEAFVVGVLFRILAEIRVPSEKKTAVETVMHYLSVNYMHPIRIEEIADIVHLNRKYLVRLFKKETGLTMQQFLTRQRMREAAALLSSGCCVSEASARVGYSDAFALSKAFKKYYGIPPKQYQYEKNRQS